MIKKLFNHLSWLLVLLNVFGSKVNGQCYQSTYGRGVGKVLSTCNSDEEKNGLLCYPKCRKDYFGNGPICYEQCRNGYSNTGTTCFRGIDTYTKSLFSNCNIWINRSILFYIEENLNVLMYTFFNITYWF